LLSHASVTQAVSACISMANFTVVYAGMEN
jgi:hypothetical protein